MGQCWAEGRVFSALNCVSNFLKYISAVVQKNVIPLNAEMTFFFCGSPMAVSGPLSPWP